VSAADRSDSEISCRLWSFQDLMNPFPVSDAIKLAHVVGHFYPDFVGPIGRHFGNGDWKIDRIISHKDRVTFAALYANQARFCEIHGLGASLSTIRKMVGSLSDPKTTYGCFFGYGQELFDRLADETEVRDYLSLGLKEAAYYRDDAPFGLEVSANFQIAEYDIEEASKCLALERGTAAAFHSIRCLESGIRALSRCLGISDPIKAADRSWFRTLDAFRAEMDRRWVGSASRLTGDGRFFEEAYAALAAMMNPWRNATMHLDQKYTPEEAVYIFEVVKGFMKKVASRCDEEGNPKA
jgi:hypothetical protein